MGTRWYDGVESGIYVKLCTDRRLSSRFLCALWWLSLSFSKFLLPTSMIYHRPQHIIIACIEECLNQHGSVHKATAGVVRECDDNEYYIQKSTHNTLVGYHEYIYNSNFDSFLLLFTYRQTKTRRKKTTQNSRSIQMWMGAVVVVAATIAAAAVVVVRWWLSHCAVPNTLCHTDARADNKLIQWSSVG